MLIKIKKSATEVTVSVNGRLDSNTAPHLDKAIAEQVEASAHLTLDLSELEYISSAGLRVLLGAQKKMQQAGSMVLVGVRGEIMDVFEMTGFADILTIK